MIDYQHFISDKVVGLKPSGIRKFFDVAAMMDDVISLGVGEPDFETPWRAAKAGIRSVEKGYTFYSSNSGLIELREELSKYFEERFSLTYRAQDEIFITVGGSEGIDNVLRAYISNGDEVIVPEPCFVCYAPLVTVAGGTPVALPTREEDEFRVTPELLRAAITPKTKLLILSYPNNPTGAVMTRADFEALAPIIEEHNLLVVSDEIYAELTYGDEHVCFASIPGMKERTIVVSGFSKAFAMTGWRIGYVIAPAPLIKPILLLHQYAVMCAPTMSQYAALEALRSCRGDTARMCQDYDKRRHYLLGELRRMGLTCFEARGAFYLFPSIAVTGLSSEEFCERLLAEQKVAVVPGSAFGDSGEGHVRISYSYSMDHLREAVARIDVFLTQFK